MIRLWISDISRGLPAVGPVTLTRKPDLVDDEGEEDAAGVAGQKTDEDRAAFAIKVYATKFEQDRLGAPRQEDREDRVDGGGHRDHQANWREGPPRQTISQGADD